MVLLKAHPVLVNQLLGALRALLRQQQCHKVQ